MRSAQAWDPSSEPAGYVALDRDQEGGMGPYYRDTRGRFIVQPFDDGTVRRVYVAKEIMELLINVDRCHP